jgi:hypothetical protein
VTIGPYEGAGSRPINYNAEGNCGRFLLAKFGTGDKTAKVAIAATDKIIGVFTDIDVLDKEPCDVHRDGVRRVIYGAAVTKGDRLTANAAGRGIPTVTQGDSYVGIAEITGVAGDIGSVAIVPGVI